MDSTDVISHISDILNTNLLDSEKIDLIQEEINMYFDELMEEKE